MNKTAVQWLIDKISNQPIDDINDEYWFEIIGEALEKEKQQIIDAFYGGYNYDGAYLEETSQQYYNNAYEN
jgi:hypothetical protein